MVNQQLLLRANDLHVATSYVVNYYWTFCSHRSTQPPFACKIMIINHRFLCGLQNVHSLRYRLLGRMSAWIGLLHWLQWYLMIFTLNIFETALWLNMFLYFILAWISPFVCLAGVTKDMIWVLNGSFEWSKEDLNDNDKMANTNFPI